MDTEHQVERKATDRDDFSRRLQRMTKAELIAELLRLSTRSHRPSELAHQIEKRDEEIRVQDSELRETRALLDESRDRYAELYDYAPLIYVTLDPDGTVLEINLTGCKLLGLERESVVNHPLADHVCSADAAKLGEHMRRCRAGEGQVVSQLSLRKRSGETIPAQLISRPGVTKCGETAGKPVFWTAVTELTELKHVERELRASEERLKLAQSAGGVGTWDVDLIERKMRWSDEQFGLLGLTPGSAEPTYELWKQCLHSEDRDSPSLADLCRRTITGLPNEYRIVRPDGQVRWLSSRGQTLLDEDGKPARIVGITIDVTQSKETQQQLQDLNEALLQRTEEAEQRTNQLRAVAAQLTQTENRERRRLAMLLHDHLQQLLIASRMKLGALKQQLKTPELGKMLRQTAELIDEAIQASRSLSVELSPPMLYDAGLAASLEWLAQQMQEKHGLAVEVEATDEPEDEDIRIFLFQCVRELLFNIVKHAQAGRATVVMERLNSDHIVIRVRDKGRGFDISRLEAGWSKGESFGLLSIRERLQLLGGRLEIQSTPGEGTTMQLIAPVRKPRTKPSEVEKLLTPAARVNPPAAEPVKEAPIRILVADDHPIVRQGLTSLLEHEPDFKIVAQAGDAESAIETACNVAVDVVLMDFSMPQLNGAEATRRIHEAKPDLPVIGMSVYQEQSVADSMRQAGAVAFFRKDESSEHLVTVIRAYGRHTKGR